MICLAEPYIVCCDCGPIHNLLASDLWTAFKSFKFQRAKDHLTKLIGKIEVLTKPILLQLTRVLPKHSQAHGMVHVDTGSLYQRYFDLARYRGKPMNQVTSQVII